MTAPLWKSNRDELLTLCRGNGLSFAQSAAEINAAYETSYTKNACISRAARLGLPKDERRVKAASGQPSVAEPAQRSKRCKPAPLPDVPAPALGDDPPICEAIDLPGGDEAGLITVLDLQRHHCRFPLGEAPYHFCGAHKREGFSYCAEHVAMTHNREGMR